MLSLLYGNAVYNRLQPTRVKYDSLGIGLLPSRDAQTPMINLTPGYQFLAVGEQASNVFAFTVDMGGVAINSPLPDRSTANGQASLIVDGDVRITGVVFANSFINAPTLTYTNESDYITTAIAWGIALPNMGAFYDNPVLVGTSNQALYNTNGFQVFRSTLNYDWDNAQVRIDNTQGAQLNLGFVGIGTNSPAIVNTPPGVNLEFHAGRPTAYFTTHYTDFTTVYGGSNTYDTPLYTPSSTISDYPHLIIDANGNVGIHTNAVTTYDYVLHSDDVTHGYPSISYSQPIALDVHGLVFASNILIYDYVTELPQVLDNIYFRRNGISVQASNIGPGPFLMAGYSFPCNIALGGALLDDRYSLNVNGNVQITDTIYVRNLMKADNLYAVESVAVLANVRSDLTVQQRLFLQGELLVEVDTPYSDTRALPLVFTYFSSNNAWYDGSGNVASSTSNVVTVPTLSTYDGYYFAGETFTFANGTWSDAGNVTTTTLTQVASNLYAYIDGNSCNCTTVIPLALNSEPPSLTELTLQVTASMTSNYVLRTYERANFIAGDGTLSNVQYFGTGMSVGGRWGCGIGTANSVNSQLVAHNVTPEIFGLEVSDDSSSLMTRVMYTGSANFDNATNPTDFGATLFLTPASDDPRFYSSTLRDRALYSQHMYFLPGYDLARTVLETDATLTPSLALMGDSTHFVGVHTRTPTHTLHVEGDVYFSGALSDATGTDVALFHATEFTDSTNNIAVAATFLTSSSNPIQHMAIFAAPDSRYGLRVGNILQADQYYTADHLRLGEIVFQDTANGATPHISGKNMFTLNNLCIGKSTPNSAIALEIISPLTQQTRVRITKNAASVIATLEMYMSAANNWVFTGNDTFGTFTLQNQGVGLPIGITSPNALVTAYKANAYRVGINTTTALYDAFSNNSVLMVNGNALVNGDLNVTGRYLSSGQVVLNASFASNAAAIGDLITTLALGNEDVFIGGDSVFVNPQTALIIGATSPPPNTTPGNTFMLQLSTCNAPLAQFTTTHDIGYLELAIAPTDNPPNHVRLQVSPNRFDLLNTSSSIPMISFYSATTNLDAPFAVVFNTPTGANSTTFQVHDPTGGLNHSLMVSCDNGTSTTEAPSLSLARVTGTNVDSYWSLSGPYTTYGTRLSFFYNSSELASLQARPASGNNTFDGCFSVGTNPYPVYGVDVLGQTADGATVATASATPGIPATVQLTGGTGTRYALTAGDAAFALSQTFNDVLHTVMQIDTSGNVGLGFDAAPDGYGLNMLGNLNVMGNICINGVPVYTVTTNDYAVTNAFQYLLPGYDPAAGMVGGTFVGVGTATATSNLFYISDPYDGGCAVFQSETLDAHIDLYSMPIVSAYPGHATSVGRIGLDNSQPQPGFYLAMRPNGAQSPSLFVDPSAAGIETAATVYRTSNYTYAATVYGDATATGTLAGSVVTDGVATLSGGTLTAASANVGPLQVTSNVLIAGTCNANLTLASGAASTLVVSVDGTSGTSTLAANDTYAISLDATSVQFQLPVAANHLSVNNLTTRSSNAVYVDNLNVTGSLIVNGLAFADFPHSEFLINNTDYVIGLGGVQIVGNEIGKIYSSTQLTIGTVAPDMVGMMTSNPAVLTLTGATVVDATPTELIQLARPGSNTPSTRASMAVSRHVAASTDDGTGAHARLDVLLATSDIQSTVAALTLVTDASGHPMVGVGTTPKYALDVVGDLNITGSFFQAAQSVNINDVILITPSSLQFADSNVVITSRYCGIGTAAAATDAPTTPLDVFNNVNTAPLARFSTSNATGVVTFVAGTTVAQLTTASHSLGLAVGNASLALTDGLLALGSSSASNAALGLRNWQLQTTPAGTFRLHDALSGSDRLTVDSNGNVGLLGYSFASYTGADSTYTALALTGAGLTSPFVYFFGYGADGGGGVSIGGVTSGASSVGPAAVAYPFTVLADTLGNGQTSGGVNNTTVGSSQFINSMPLRLMVAGAISCYAISSFTGQHLVMFNHPKWSADYLGLVVELTGAFQGNAYSLDQSTPIVEFARTRCSKAAYGILCSCSGGSPYAYVALVNSVGEGSMWVCDVNGDLDIGDYVTTSSIAGYGMRQNDDLLHSYTVAKCSIKVPFKSLPSWMPHKTFSFKDPYDREIKFVTACLIPCTYHCA